jgi:hypothetical protein
VITTKPFQSGYAWCVGCRLTHVDATRVGHEIEAIGDDTVARDDIIAAGIGGNSELAKCFTQDRDEAAHKCWESEADYMMRSLVPVIVDPRTEDKQPINQHVWMPVYQETRDNKDAGVYRRMSIAVQELLPPDTEPDRHMRAWTALMAWRERYGDDPWFAPIVAAINALEA